MLSLYLFDLSNAEEDLKKNGFDKNRTLVFVCNEPKGSAPYCVSFLLNY